MLTLSGTIVANVGEEYILTYLKSKKYEKTEANEGKAVQYWVDDLIRQKVFDLDDFEKFLFGELFWGKRKSIRFYKLAVTAKLKNPDDWIENLQNYNIDNLNFIHIMEGIPSEKSGDRIVAIVSKLDYKGNLSKIQLLFAAYAEVIERGRIKETTAYYPVEIDFQKKCMTIKAWNRQGLQDGYKLEERLNHIAAVLSLRFGVKTKSYMMEHKKTLHNMSRGLVTDVYEKIPAFRKIGELEERIGEFQQEVLNTLPLKHLERCDGEVLLQENVFDFKDELKKILEKLCISDYFYDIPYEEIWNMGVQTIVSKIKFKDLEHVLTILSSEESETPIFCTKTFMSLKKSLEDAKVIERLWIEHDRKHGRLKLSYDATKEEFLEVKILSQIRFKEDDLAVAREIYHSYAETTIRKIEGDNQKYAV